MRLRGTIPVLLVAATLSACVSAGRYRGDQHAFMQRPVVDVREHMFLSQPLWESSKLAPPPREAAARRAQTFAGALAQTAEDAPGLAMLVNQVFREDIAAEGQGRGVAELAAARVELARLERTVQSGTTHLVGDPAPLPSELAQLAVTKVLVGSLFESRIRASAGAAPALPRSVPKTLSLRDFWEFTDKLSRTAVQPYQSTPTAAVAARDLKLQRCKDRKQIAWECLYASYLTAYYNGEFVDKNGGTYSKPKFGLTIANETITAVVAAFLEATYDLAIIEAKEWKAPVIYTPSPQGPRWHTKDRRKPTLITVIETLPGVRPEAPELGFVVQPASTDGTRMNATKLCVARLLGGLAGDGAQSLTGVTMRLFGGAEVGFVVLGKFSFGDNDTLTKVVDTFVENTVRRLTDGAIAHALYERNFAAAGAPEPLASALALAGSLPDCK